MTYRQVESERAGRDSDGPIIPPYASYRSFIRGLREGHEAALTGLNNHYGKPALSRAGRIVGFTDAGDVVNTAFFNLYKKFTSGNPPDDRVEKEAGLTRLMFTIIYSVGVDMYRRKRRSRFVEIPLDEYLNSGSEEPESNDGNPEEKVLKQMEQVNTAQMVRTALTKLPPSQRETLEAHYFGNLTQVQIAKTSDTPLGTVKTREWLGKKHMRELLTSQGYQP